MMPNTNNQMRIPMHQQPNLPIPVNNHTSTQMVDFILYTPPCFRGE